MPRWVRWLVVLTVLEVQAILVFVVAPFLLSQAVKAGEPSFTPDQRSYLSETYPGGTFTSASLYKWCDGRLFLYFDSRGDSFNYAQSCWKVDR